MTSSTAVRAGSAALLLAVASGLAARAADAVRPPDLTNPITVDLPSAPDDAVPAGGGRYLAFVCPAANTVAVFDVNTGAIAGQVPLADADSRVVGTLSRLYVIAPRTRTVAAYKVGKFEQDGKLRSLPRTLPNEPPGAACAAPGADGLILMQFPKAKVTVGLEPQTMTYGPLRWRHFGDAWGPAELRVSADGSLAVGWGGGWAGLEAALIRDRRAVVLTDEYKHGPVRWALPSADGRVIYTSAGQLARDMTFLAGHGGPAAYQFPAMEPGYYLSPRGDGALADPDPAGPGDAGGRNRVASGPLGGVDVFTADGQKVAAVGDAVLDAASALPPEKRVFLYPAAGAVVAVGGPRRTAVVLRRFDLKAELDKAGGDYLVVASTPPPAHRNAQYTYPLTVLSKKGGVTVKLEKGPPGMRLDGTKLTWFVPFETRLREVEFIVAVTDASARRVLHTGRVEIRSPK